MPPLVCLGSRGKLNNTPHPDHPALPRNNNRQQVEGLLEENPKFQALDKAIAKEGFKVILLLRLSPIFPFALSSYLYGATSVDFFEYMMGTLIGFFPGTLAYVYGGTVRVCIACSSRTFLFQSFFFRNQNVNGGTVPRVAALFFPPRRRGRLGRTRGLLATLC